MMKKALLTGVTGYIGSCLAARLQSEGWEVHGLVRPKARLERLGPGLSSVSLHEYDGRAESMLKIVERVRPDVTFHLASLYLREHVSKDVRALIESNILFGAELAEALSVCGRPHLVNTGTVWQHYQNKAYNPLSLYAATKQAFEDILEFYRDQETLKTVTLEIFDTYGPKDPRPKLFGALEKAGGTPMDMVDGKQKLHLVYIDDAVEAYVVAAKRLLAGRVKRGETYALYSQKAVTLRQFIALYVEETGRALSLNWGARPYKTREVMVPWHRGRRLPGWTPKVSLREGIKRAAGLE